MAAGLPRCRGAGACTRLSAAGWLRRCPWRRPGFMASRGPGDGYAGGCRRVQGPSESLSVGTCAVLAPCLREARSCLVAAWCRGGCCPRGPAPGDLVLLLLVTRAPYAYLEWSIQIFGDGEIWRYFKPPLKIPSWKSRRLIGEW